ncbi:acyl-CoA dehydrogenase family protein [Actinokineospora sp. NBRC 105648]|uniref:acyl-CoA dehydrogenase family protein n=1 Tax=Actinokineospora sp. NBRC 105648 TaxID=3032206 RepID=UPI0024A0E3E0|nr:acyl-CoA dehydrogenase family protein [Actinokineospora sp. NBRC 105648]GLZ42028.1 hydroxylase [Actinokineospora sp. NBRC 105648]
MPVHTAPDWALEAAKPIAADLADRVADIEAARTLPTDLVERFRAAGLFSLALPRSLGGPECAPLAVLDTVAEVSRADASAGWSLLIGQGSGFLAWLDPAVAGRLLAGTPNPVIASSMAPAGRGVPTDNGFVLDGRWPYVSGCLHSDWVLLAFAVADPSGEPVSGPGGAPVVRMAFVPSGELAVLDTWRAAGLRGTGSHDVAAREVRVPAELVIDPLFERAKVGGPLYGASMFSFLMMMMAGFPLGVGRRALDEFAATARRKTKPGTDVPLAEDEGVQHDLVLAETSLRAARALLVAAIGDVVEAVGRDAADPPVRARLAAAVVHAMTTAREVVQTAFHACGASALYSSHPLQRCFRDIHAAAAHVAFSQDSVRRLGRIELGLPAPTFLV